MTAETKLAARRGLHPIRTLPAARVVKKFDVLQGLAQVIEHGRSAFEKRATVVGRRDASGTAVEQRHTHGPLQISNRSGNGGLRRVEECGGLVHAAGLHDRHQDMKVVQFHPASDAIVRLHVRSLLQVCYNGIRD